MRYIISFLIVLLFLTGCAPKKVDLATLNPTFLPNQEQRIAVYDVGQDSILFYEFSFENGILVERTWGKMLPFRVEPMDLWITGLGHDLRRLTNGHAETIKDALMYHAKLQGMQTLHVNQKDYIIDDAFAHEMRDIINAYEERMKRYDKEREFPFLLKKLKP